MKKRLADGSLQTYYYARRGGPRIKAKFGSPDFVAEYLKHNSGGNNKLEAKPKPNTLDYLISLYLESRAFLALSEPTRREYRRYLVLIGAKFGNAPLDTVSEPSAVREYRRWHHSMEDTPRAANYALSVLKLLLSWGVASGNIVHNPALAVKKHKVYGDRSKVLWSTEQIEAIKSNAPVQVWLPFQVALLTSQRKKDILEMKWSAYDGNSLRIVQSKGKKSVWVKVSQELREILDSLPRTSKNIFLNSKGQPWTLSGYDSSWQSAKKASGVSGVTFHDTRGTAITLAYIGGASLREIALMSGHTEVDLEKFLNKHYLNRSAASDAIEAIERAKSVN